MSITKIGLIFILLATVICPGSAKSDFPNTATQVWQDLSWNQGGVLPAGAILSTAGPFDSDNDGNQEFVLSSSLSGSIGNDVGVYEIDGNNNATQTWYFDLSSYGVDDPANVSQVEVGDLDGDSIPEILVLLDTSVGQDCFLVFEYDEVLGNFPSAPTTTWNIGITFILHEAGDMAVEDIDGDGTQEVVVALVTAPDWFTSQITIFSLQEDSSFASPVWKTELSEQTTTFPLYTAGYLTRVTDLDQDGLKEIVLVGWEWFHFCIYEASGVDTYSLQTDFYATFEPLSHCDRGAFEANFDGDGTNELYMVSTGVDTTDAYLWAVTNTGDVSTMDFQSSFHLLHSFPKEDGGWDMRELTVSNLDSPRDGPYDNPDIYIAGGSSGKVFDLEYQGGDVTDGSNYTINELWAAPNYGDLENGWFKPSRMVMGYFDDDQFGDLLVFSSDFTNRDIPHVVWLEFSEDVSGNESTELPGRTNLTSVYPNPFNPKTHISFELKTKDSVLLEVFDVHGTRIRTLLNETREAGNYTVDWDGRNNRGAKMASGIYLVRLKTTTEQSMQKLVLAK